jgi:hypothetical protein
VLPLRREQEREAVVLLAELLLDAAARKRRVLALLQGRGLAGCVRSASLGYVTSTDGRRAGTVVYENARGAEPPVGPPRSRRTALPFFAEILAGAGHGGSGLATATS